MYGYTTQLQGQFNATTHAMYAPAPGYAVPISAPVPAVPSPPFIAVGLRTPSPPVLNPVAVPPGCYPIELVQFWRDEYKRGQPFPLHWALFLRTAPRASSTSRRPGHRTGSMTPTTTARGNFYELAGTQETYTAQFLYEVTFEPDMLPDWRGTHVIGWVHPTHVAVFERAVRHVPVLRHRPDWRCQHWAYEVVRAVGNEQGVGCCEVTFGGLQQHMARLLDAWENGDI